jgi:hypothetical protein
MAAVGCILGFVAQAARGAAPEETRGSTHVLVLAAEALAGAIAAGGVRSRCPGGAGDP